MLLAPSRRDQWAVLAALCVVIGPAWGWLLLGAGIEMDRMDMGGGQIMLMSPQWTPGYAALMFLMWAVMMVAMMLPSAAPAILLAAALMRQRGGNRVFGPTGLFALGYLWVWFGFSLLATILQWGLDRTGLLSMDMASTSHVLAGILLIAAGLYQWTPFKQACLTQCRSPFDYFSKYWRRGPFGPMLAGASHGLFCLGCCWTLMALLFVGGLMNLLWIAGLALLVLIEKLLPAGARVGRLAGIGLVIWGAAVLLSSAVSRGTP
jgi:predicted metal-binding membrane protein